MQLLTVLLESGVSVYAIGFVLEADILSTYWNKDCVMWHVRQWLFRETITVSHVCCYSVNHSNAYLLCWRLNLTLQIFQGSVITYFRWSGHFRHSFVKGFFWDNRSNFYWNWLIFDNAEQKISWHSFFRHGVYLRLGERLCFLAILSRVLRSVA